MDGDGAVPTAPLCGGRPVENSEDLGRKAVQVLGYFNSMFSKLHLSAYLL